MNNFMIPAALVIAFLFALMFGALFSRRRFWRGFFLVFLILFLVGWSEQLWITPFGPILWGVSWLSLFFVMLIFSLLILALTSPVNVLAQTTTSDKNAEEASAVAFGIFFWFLIILLITSIAIGYYRIPPIVDGIK